MADVNHPSALSGALRRPYTQQVAFFRQKIGNRVPTRRWDDLTGDAHDTAFVVAGANEADLLTDLVAATESAISRGQGIESFRKDFREIVGRNGWTNWTGEGTRAGEARRVRTILRTNARTSYAAGRYAQLRDANLPFWVYRHGGSLDPRVIHLSWDGLVLPPDHPFWTTHYPPSDWGCTCYALGASSERAARRLGGDPDKKLPANWQTIDPRTGEQQGIGKGWGYAPGASVVQAVSVAAAKVGSWDYQIGKAFMEALPLAERDALGDAFRALPSTADDLRRYAQRVYEPKPDLPPLPPQRTIGQVRSDQAKEIQSLVGRAVDGFDFSIDESAIGHVVREHAGDTEASRGQRAPTPDDFARLPRLLSDPDAIVLAGTSTMDERLVDISKTIDGETYVATFAVRGSKRRTIALKTFFIRSRKLAKKRK